MIRLYQSPLSRVRVYGPLPIKIDCILCSTMCLPDHLLSAHTFAYFVLAAVFFLTQHLYFPLSPGPPNFTVHRLRCVDI